MCLCSFSPAEFSHQNHPSSGSGSVPLLLLSPPETSAGETNAVSHQRPQPSLTKRTHEAAFTPSHQSSDRVPHSHTVDGEDGRKGNKEDSSLLHPEDEGFLLPRSSPVISRRHRPVSWHGEDTHTAVSPSSLDTLSPAPGALSLDVCWRPTLTSLEDLGSRPSPARLQEGKRTRQKGQEASVSPKPSHRLSIPISGQQRLAEEHRGRSLTAPHTDSRGRRSSGIAEISADTFKTCCELEKENAHFVVVDMVLEVLEGVKWTLSFDQWTSTMDTHQHTHCKTTCTHTHESSCSEEEEAEHQPKTFSVLSTDSGFEDCGVDLMLTPTDSLRDAEQLAQQLVLEFRRSWLPSSYGLQRGQQSLRSSLQELPGTGGAVLSGSSLTDEIRLRTRMRGSLSWAPPRVQIIFTVQPTHRRSEVVALQHFLCAGCGTEVEPKYIKKLRYCEYLGKYFCDCCHSGSEAVIPGRVLSCWDFGRYPVSDFSKQLLDSVWHQPLFDLTCVGKSLYSRVKELDKFRELQGQLLGIKKLLTACRLSGSVMSEFEQLPAHLTQLPHVFSMDDLLRAKKGQLVVQSKALLHSALSHVENCQLCLARGFICEFCRKKDVIFPFQIGICKRCPVCRTCFHKHCFAEKKCPKCARIQSRKKRPDGCMEEE
ncbi:protein associated with UVRAG as autophagy enhancer [Symphorus nematophorus]